MFSTLDPVLLRGLEDLGGGGEPAYSSGGRPLLGITGARGVFRTPLTRLKVHTPRWSQARLSGAREAPVGRMRDIAHHSHGGHGQSTEDRPPGGRGTPVRALRMVVDFESEHRAPREVVFPLLCPVREYDWIEDWRCQVLYSDSGVAEDDCLFVTDFDGRSTWVVTAYEPPARIEFCIFNEREVVARLKIRLEAAEGGGCRLRWRRIYTRTSSSDSSMGQPTGDLSCELVVRPLGVKASERGVDHLVRGPPQPEGDFEPLGRGPSSERARRPVVDHLGSPGARAHRGHVREAVDRAARRGGLQQRGHVALARRLRALGAGRAPRVPALPVHP